MGRRARKRPGALLGSLAALSAVWASMALAAADAAPSRAGAELRLARARHPSRCAGRRGHRRHAHTRHCAVRHRRAVEHAPAKAPAAPAQLAPAVGVSLVQPLAPAPAPAPAAAPAPVLPTKGQGGGAPPPGEPPSIPHVQVTAVEYSFTLSRTTVPAGKVVLELVNSGQDPHNVNLAPPEGPSEEPIANTPASQVADVTVQLQPGAYTLFCSLPTHAQKGMKATLTVE